MTPPRTKRSVPEWVGKTPDSAAPPTVRLRNFRDHDGRCHICGLKIHVGEKWDSDHVKRIEDGGVNRESNLAPAHRACHSKKTAEENRRQAKADRMAKKHLGIKPRKSRPIAGSKASGWKRKMDGTVERRT